MVITKSLYDPRHPGTIATETLFHFLKVGVKIRPVPSQDGFQLCRRTTSLQQHNLQVINIKISITCQKNTSKFKVKLVLQNGKEVAKAFPHLLFCYLVTLRFWEILTCIS